ncbi:MAG: DoxX family protein [Bacteroidales bacterium]|nr:DoxX family protein [Bacteroidales bacterium]
MNANKEPIIIMILRIAIACVFIYSGIAKALDPVATSYTFDDYFFSFHLSFFQIFSTFAAFVMPMIEFVLGVMMLVKINIKLTSSLYLIMMAFFLLLTAWLALAEHLEKNYGYNLNVVKDCGCFGTEVKLTNFQTFMKNVILIIPTVIVFFYRKRIPDVRMTALGKWVVFGIACISCLILEAHCYRHLPLKDNSDWKIGTDLTEKYIDQDLITKSVFIYQDTATGEVVKITEEEMAELPDDSPIYNMEYVSDETDTIQKFVRAENYNFTMEDKDNNDLKSSLINKKNKRPLYLLFMQDLDQTEMEALQDDDLQEIIQYCKTHDCDFYGLTNTPRVEIDKFVKDNKIPFEILCCSYFDVAKGHYFVRDAIHSNPGIIRVEQGKVTGKWAWRDFDDVLDD